MDKVLSALFLEALNGRRLHVLKARRLGAHLFLDIGTHRLLVDGIEEDRHDKDDDHIRHNSFQHTFEGKPFVHRTTCPFRCCMKSYIASTYTLSSERKKGAPPLRRRTLFIQSYQNSTSDEAWTAGDSVLNTDCTTSV